MASDGWGARPAPAGASSPYTKIIGVGLAAALSTTAIFTLMHRDAFRHSSWGGVMASAATQMRTAATAWRGGRLPANQSKAALPAKTVAAAALPAPAVTGTPAAVLETPSWLPDGLGAVSVERSGRLAGRSAVQAAVANGSSGLRDIGIGRSTRLALAEPRPSKELIRNLEAARPPAAVASATPLPEAGPPVKTASLEPAVPSAVPGLRPAPPAVADAVPVPANVPTMPTVADAAPVPPAKAPTAPEPQQALEIPLPKIRPVRTAALEAAPADTAPAPTAMAALETNDGPMLPQSAPLPTLRPQRAVRTETASSRPTRGPQPPAPARPTRGPQPASQRYELAYASPETTKSDSDGGFLGRLFGSGRSRLPGVGSGVAVYSIKDATVYLPNGEKLEAHSGMGQMTDNPRYADEKMRGPTPPNVYNLSMREHLFHGVEAVRMLPADGRNKFGRDGFLAHTYMLRGRPGESNGCVVFRNYAKFLRAFKNGKIDRMVVVPDLSHLPTQVASR